MFNPKHVGVDQILPNFILLASKSHLNTNSVNSILNYLRQSFSRIGTYIQGEEHGTPVYAVLLRASVQHVSFPIIHEYLNTTLGEHF